MEKEKQGCCPGRQEVRQRSSSEPWKRAGRWRALQVPCASARPRESLWMDPCGSSWDCSSQDPPPSLTGQRLSRAAFPAAFDPCALIPPARRCCGQGHTREGLSTEKAEDKSSTELGEALAEGGRGTAAMLRWPRPSPGRGVCISSPNNRRRGREESADPEKMEPCFARASRSHSGEETRGWRWGWHWGWH